MQPPGPGELTDFSPRGEDKFSDHIPDYAIEVKEYPWRSVLGTGTDSEQFQRYKDPAEQLKTCSRRPVASILPLIGYPECFGKEISRRQTITVTQKYLSGIRGRNEMVKNVTVIS